MNSKSIGLLAVALMGVSSVALSAEEAFLTFDGADNGALGASINLDPAQIASGTVTDILSFSWGVVSGGNINFVANSVPTTPLDPTVTCTGNCFETTPDGLMQMNPGDSATFSVVESPFMQPTVVFTPTNNPNVVSAAWYNAYCPTIVDNGTGQFTLVKSVPEPGTLSLLGLGLAGVGFVRRRRKTA